MNNRIRILRQKSLLEFCSRINSCNFAIVSGNAYVRIANDRKLLPYEDGQLKKHLCNKNGQIPSQKGDNKTKICNNIE